MAIEYLDDEAPAASNPKIEYLDDYQPPSGPIDYSKGLSAKEMGHKAMHVGTGAMEALASPFQVAGEAVRGASENEPLRVATKEDPRGFRAPSIVQRFAPSLQTDKPPADPFQKAYQGLEGIANLPSGLKTASDVVTGEPDVAAQAGGMGLALGVMAPKAPGMAKVPAAEMTGGTAMGRTAVADLPEIPAGAKTGDARALFAYTEKEPMRPGMPLEDKYQVFGDPENPTIKEKGWGTQMTPDQLDQAGIPIAGKVPPRPSGFATQQKFADMPGPESKFVTPPDPLKPLEPMGGGEPKFTGASQVPPDPNAPPIPPKTVDPLQAVKDSVREKFGKAQGTAGLKENIGKSLEQKSKGMELKEIGASPGQIRKLRDEYGEPMVEGLADLAQEKGITKGFFNFQTRDAIKNLDKTSGADIGALRQIARERGAIHTPDELLSKIQAELDPIYLKGSDSAHKGPYLKALQDIKNSGMDVESLANTISEKNKFAAKNKLTIPAGPNRDVMKIANRLNNEKINSVLNPQEQALLKSSLKDFSAAKVFHKMSGFQYGRDMAGRTGPGSVLNTAKDLGGRKFMQKMYSKVGKGLQETPSKFGDTKGLTHEVLDSINESLDEVIDQMGSHPPEAGMAHGGIVGEMGGHLEAKYGTRK